ncbi:MAG: hypothetical protein KDK61_07930 [Simkania sp.]|nr:hypothetical protein [Simkania sp.]
MGDTVSVLNNGSVVAGEAFSGVFVPGVAEIAHGDASLFSVEVPSLGASLAYVVVPEGASDVGRGGFVDLLALAVDDGVSLKAFFADSFFLVELLAGSLDLAADSVLIEVVSF